MGGCTALFCNNSSSKGYIMKTFWKSMAMYTIFVIFGNGFVVQEVF